MGLPFISSRGYRGQTTAVAAGGGGGGEEESSVFNVETIDTTSNLEARTGDSEGFLAYNKTTNQLYVAYGSNLWSKYNAD